MIRVITAVIFFLSGFSTLIYQVIWQRVLTQEIGVDFISIALIVTIFMIGLGFGTLAGGVVATRHKSKLPYLYVAMEAAIGIFGLFSITLIRSVNNVAAQLGVQSIFFDFLVNGIVLLVPIFIMGMTTPVIIEFMKTTLERVGSVVGMYYGVNVLGAAVGALATGIFFIELFGMQRTILLAAGINFCISVVFLVSVKILKVQVLNISPEKILLNRYISFANVPRHILFASVLFGFVTLAMEMILFRVVTNYFSSWPPLFAFMLSVFLVMLATGEAMAGGIVDHIRRQHVLLLMLALLIATVGTMLVILHIPLLYIYDTLKVTQFAVYNEPYKSLELIALFMLPVFFVAGFLPIVVKVATKDIDEVSTTFAAILFMFTVGNFLGSYITAIWLIEYFGTLTAFVICMGIAALGIYCMYFHASMRQRSVVIGVSGALLLVLIMAMPWKYFFQSTGYLRNHFKATKVEQPDVKPIAVIEDREAVTVIVPDKNVYHIRPFWGNSAMTTADINVGVYAWSLSQLLIMDPGFRPKRILQIGTGGNQFAYVMKEHDFVEKITVVELTRAVLEGHQKWSHPDIASVIHGHPKVEYVITDGRRFVQKALAKGEKFDFIQIGVNNLKQIGTNNVYSINFLKKVKALLNPGGYVGLFSYTGLTRMGLELWNSAFVFPDAKVWVFFSDGPFETDQKPITVSQRLARFYTANRISDLDKAVAVGGLRPLKVRIYKRSDFFAPYELSTDDNLSYEYWMLRTRRKDNNNPEIYLWDQQNVPFEEKVYPLCLESASSCDGVQAGKH